jgi:NADPH:quinone reductase-like Zn-dependent oxidoreductase
MKTVVICDSANMTKSPDSICSNFSISNTDVTFGIMDIKDPDFREIFSDHSVVLNIKAFSCNYRDKSMMLIVNDLCKKNSEFNKRFVSPFGSEFVAEVMEVGKKVKTVKVGDRVIPNASYPYPDNKRILPGLPTNHASQRIQIMDESKVIKIPDSMPDEVAAAFTIASQTAYSMFRRLDLKKNDNVLVTAATSNTSLSAISILANNGINVYGISTRKEYENQLLNLGVKKVIPFNAFLDNTVKDFMDDLRFNAIIDPFSDIYLSHVINYMDYFGKYTFCGVYNQNRNFEKYDYIDTDFSKIAFKMIAGNISLIGNCLGNSNDLKKAINDYSNGKYNLTLDSVYTNDNITPFIEKSFHLSSKFGKVVYKY